MTHESPISTITTWRGIAVEALSRAKDIASGAAIAREFSISRAAVNQWEICPAERVLGVERATGGKVTRHQLRPDLYPPADEVGEEAA